MLKSKFYVCPICGNIIHSIGEAAISCHGILLQEEVAEESEEDHYIDVQVSEGEYFVHMDHPMTKDHYISFLAALAPDRIQMVKLYPEGNAQARFQMAGTRILFAYCNREGLFKVKL